ncbi:heavy metal translocating P-type ATPase [Pelagovum pacificum]|uniref:Cadmium-translocating P-type ATPase n=1 Tax=Pelagovum pacificum TaxID=2588711 RepID=A0A5C5GC42_9RHOB|nr:heavy metal translocating P-type ATPase [Pelagovum pacificum]QQA44814.1 cadmium-translocating P-type ATPase [Pelagovum pacificum]TNY32080.1 cadmium-translocating P-type ATPase [Pelagovum pacificum]
MALVEHVGPASCPGCLAIPREGAEATGTGGAVRHLSLPSIHCASCISGVEAGLAAMPGVAGVQVNLTRKRATVQVDPGITAEALAARLSALGYEAQPLDGATLSAGEADRTARDLLMRLGVAGFAMMNVMLLSVAVWSGASDATRDLFHWISAAIALPTISFSAQPFFRSGFAAIRAGRLNMDVPISLAILLAAGMSLFETINHGSHAYFDAALSLTFFLLAGRVLDQKTRATARSAAAELAALEAPVALRLGADGTETVRTADLAVGDVVLVRPGGRVPVDGIVTEGESDIDRAFLTGESDPVTVSKGEALRAGEVNLTGPLTLRATAVGEDTLLHGLADLVAVAEQARSRYNSLADRAARIYAPAVHLLALAGFVTWLGISGDWRLAMNIAIALLIITCPCALGLAVPAVSTVASGRLFRRGLLVKHATALERLAEVDMVVFDKTGTLTTGRPRLLDGADAEALALAAALGAASDHPRARAIALAARDAGLQLPAIEQVTEVPGHGVEAMCEGRVVRLGRAGWAGPEGTGTVLSVDGHLSASFAFTEELRSGAADLIAALRLRGLPVLLLSGDAEAQVRAIAGEIGLTDWRAGMLPGEKAAEIGRLSEEGRKVLMVGDGLNDTGALAAAHVSMSPASALEAARVAADVVITAPGLQTVAEALGVARSARRRILENFGIALMYNAVAVPVAFLGLATPLSAAIAMSASSIMVSLNALRTR